MQDENILEALLNENKLKLENVAGFKFDKFDNYVYLAVEPKPPYISIKEDTQKNIFYVGPFRDRFFLLDALDSFQQFFGEPTFELIINSYLQVNQQNLKELETKLNENMENLDFIEAEKIKRFKKHIEKFYELIKFFLITKELNMKLQTCDIKSGMIEKMGNKKFSIPKIEYRKNELMAFNKDEFWERWIIFKHFQNEKTNDEIYERNKTKMVKYFKEFYEI